MNSIEIGSWNMSNAFSEGHEAEVEQFISTVAPDIVFGSEAYHEGDIEGVKNIKRLCRDLGYVALTKDYEYDEERPSHHGFMAAAKKDLVPAVEMEFVRAGNVNSLRLEARIGHEVLKAFGVHLNDRSNGLDEQLIPLMDAEAVSSEEPTVIFGDMNDAHKEDLPAAILRSKAFEVATKLSAKCIPDKFAAEERLIDIQQRLSMMAEGRRVSYLEVLGFCDVDEAHRATIPVQFPIIQLDRFMASDAVETLDFKQHRELTNLSPFHPSRLEHTGISADLRV